MALAYMRQPLRRLVAGEPVDVELFRLRRDKRAQRLEILRQGHRVRSVQPVGFEEVDVVVGQVDVALVLGDDAALLQG